MTIFEKIEALKKGTFGNYKNWQDMGIDKVLDMPEIQAIDKLVEKVKAWWDECYSEKIFNGSSGDEGAIKVVEIRELLKSII